jgi:uncharacterized membrane protein (DUF4010 family)
LIGGLVEVDAITISFSSLALSSSLSPIVAASGIIIAALSNTFSKYVLVNWFGTRKMGWEVGKVLIAPILLGLLFLIFVGI